MQEQVNAFNVRDAERFAECYADDVRVLAPDGNVMAAGKAEIKQLTPGYSSKALIFVRRSLPVSRSANS